jgi:hypothetical protein
LLRRGENNSVVIPDQRSEASAEPGSMTYAKARSALFFVFLVNIVKGFVFDSGAGYRICVRCASLVRYDDFK